MREITKQSEKVHGEENVEILRGKHPRKMVSP